MPYLAPVRVSKLWFGFLAPVVCIYIVQAYLVCGSYPTYDDGWNLHIFRQLIQGDWSNFWHHGSPLFYLCLLPPVWAAPLNGFYGPAWINLLLSLSGVYLLIQAAQKGEANWFTLAAFFTVALSPLFQINANTLTVDGGALLFLGLGLKARFPMMRGVWLALACLWNYKLLLAGGLVGVYYFAALKDHKAGFRYTLAGVIAFASVYALFLYANPDMLWLRPLATYSGLLGRDANPNASSPGLDLLFYLRYFLEWDVLLLWLAGIGSLFVLRKHWKEQPIIVLVLVYALVGFLLPKAPRFWMPVLPLMAGLVVQVATPWNLSRQVGLWAVLLGSSAYVYVTKLYYPLAGKERGWHMHAYLRRAMRTGELMPKEWWDDPVYTYYSTQQYLCDKPGEVLRELPPFPKSSHWLLVDGGSRLSGHAFPAGIAPDSAYKLVKVDSIWTNSLPQLWLEHAEYTGLTYQKTMDLWRKQGRAATELRLYHSR